MKEIDINEILKDHVTLDVECIDRIYLKGYIPNLQTGGQLVRFLRHRGYEIPSPVILSKMTNAYKAAVEAFAQEHGIPLFHFERGVRKDDVAAEYRERHGEREGVLFIGIAQERAYAYKARKRVEGKRVSSITPASRCSSTTITSTSRMRTSVQPSSRCAALPPPYAVKLCLNGNEWAKRQLH